MAEKENPLFQVYSSREAAALWGLAENTVTQWCNRGRFTADEARKSEKVWLVTRAGMIRLTGREENERMLVGYLYDFVCECGYQPDEFCGRATDGKLTTFDPEKTQEFHCPKCDKEVKSYKYMELDIYEADSEEFQQYCSEFHPVGVDRIETGSFYCR